MQARVAAAAVAVLLLGGAALVASGKMDRSVNFDSVLIIWGDVFRDAGQVGLQLTRVTDQDEIVQGRKLAQSVPISVNSGWDAYVSAVGKSLTQHSLQRPGIPYEFHVSDIPQANAFALPGGQIYITEEMLKLLQSEAELAEILGHEIAHVDLRHCVEHYQYELTARRIGVPGLGELADLANSLTAATYNKYQELDADAEGLRLAVTAGYDPKAALLAFTRLQPGAASPKPAESLAEEAGRAAGEALGNFLRSHPPSEERRQRLAEMVEENRVRFTGRSLYVGKQNYAQKIPKGQQEFADENVQY